MCEAQRVIQLTADIKNSMQIFWQDVIIIIMNVGTHPRQPFLL